MYNVIHSVQCCIPPTKNSIRNTKHSVVAGQILTKPKHQNQILTRSKSKHQTQILTKSKHQIQILSISLHLSSTGEALTIVAGLSTVDSTSGFDSCRNEETRLRRESEHQGRNPFITISVMFANIDMACFMNPFIGGGTAVACYMSLAVALRKEGAEGGGWSWSELELEQDRAGVTSWSWSSITYPADGSSCEMGSGTRSTFSPHSSEIRFGSLLRHQTPHPRPPTPLQLGSTWQTRSKRRPMMLNLG